MKVLGLSFGRKMKNCEILVKEALLEAQAMGAEVQFIRMIDLDIKPCNGCGGCGNSLQKGGSGRCVIKDDLPMVDEAFMESDAIIVAAPVYALGPSGQLKQMVDRFGPSHDRAFMVKENELRIAAGKTGDELLDPRIFKDRYAGLISVGGAVTKNWVSFGLPTMQILCFPSHIKVVDQLDAYKMGSVGHPILDDELMARVRRMGHSVTEACGKKREEVAYAGDDMGVCPVCHGSLLTVGKTTTVECPLCGIYGTLSIEGEELKVTFSEAEQKRSRVEFDGKLEHYLEIRSFPGIAAPKIKAGMEKIEAGLKKYEGFPELKPVRK